MNSESSFTPLAIVGIGCLFPKAAGPGFYWAIVKHGVDCIEPIPATHWNPEDYFDADPKAPDMTYARRGGFLAPIDFNPMEFGISPRDIEATDTSQLLGLVAAKQALNDAKIDLATSDRSKVSVILGVTGTLELVIPLGARLGHPKWKRAMKDAGIPEAAAEDASRRIAESYVPWQENSFPGLLGNVVAGRIANKLDLGGTNCVVDAACASSLSAVHLAALELQTGRADVVVSGGIDTFNDIFMYMCFSKTPALSPTGDAKPFDINGDGTILGEGLGVVVLKRLADAERDGDTVYAVLKSVGSSSDGKGNAIYAPSPDGQKKAIRNAYRLANVTPDTIELVEAHGTGTKVGDTAEITALTEVYQANRRRESTEPWVALGSVKSMIGHTKAAAGAASLIKVALALHNKALPPTLKVTQPVEPLRTADTPFTPNAKMRPWVARPEHPRRAAMSAFGFGGSNFHAVLEEHRPKKSAPDWDGSVEIVALGGESRERVEQELAQVPTSDWDAFARFAEESRSRFRADSGHRVAFAVSRGSDLKKSVAEAHSRVATGPASPVAVLFPGQGSQSVGMLRDLACLFPESLEELDRAGAALADIIYPPTRFDADRVKADDAALRDTRNAQPAIGAVSLGAWRVLHERFGLNADAFAGHSYGELTALAAAGRLSPDDFQSLSRLRGELMARERSGDSGSMLAVLAPLPEIEAAIAKHGLKLIVANKNAPKQTVLSGSTAEIERAQAAFREEKLKSSKLAVAAAFHSEFVADAAGPLRDALRGVALASAAIPVFANTTAAPYPDDAEAAKDLLANQLAKPVEFVNQIRTMLAAGVRTFVEVGPGTVLAGLVDKIVADAAIADAEVFSTDGKRGSLFELANALARLATRGVPVKLIEWEAESRCRPPEPRKANGLTVVLCGANYVTPREPRPPAPPIQAIETNRIVKVPVMSDATSDPNALAQAMLMTQQSLAALQRMQEQTALLHKQFLESQEASQRTLQSLVDQQQMLLLGGTPREPGSRITPPIPMTRVEIPRVEIPRIEAPRIEAPRIEAPRIEVVPVAKPLAGSPASAGIADTLLAVVSEKTGYPVSSLDLKLSLDSDLGVDSIKRVEILSTLQEKLPHAPQVKPEHLGTLHTLQDVANFLNNGTSHHEDEPPRTQPITRDQLQLLTREAKAESADIAGALLAVVAEKTGYPVASLDLKLSLDSDLGVDSIKRVEILSALQEKLPHAPQVKPEHLGTLVTLQDVADFLRGGTGPRKPDPITDRLASIVVEPPPTTWNSPPSLSELSAPDTEHVSSIRAPQVTDSTLHRARDGAVALGSTRPAGPAESSRSSANLLGGERIERSILQVVDLDPHSPRSRVPLAAGSEVWVVGEADGLADRVSDQLARAGLNARVMSWSGPGANKPSGSLAGLVLVAPIAPEFNVNRLAFEWLQQVAPKLRSAGRLGAAVFTTVARLDGAFGLNNLSPDADPASGGLAGLAKTARHEWPEVSCKAIDLDPAFTDRDAAAAALADEILTNGPVEVGIGATHRVALELARTVRRPGTQTINLGPKDVALVTGGARGVTAEAAAALGEAFGCTLILAGRTAVPGAEPEYLSGLTGEAELKQAIATHLGADATPKRIGEQYQKIASQREIRRTLKRLEAGGAKAAYFSVDASDGRAVADMLHQVRVKFGPITALVHGAGVLADRRIEDLTTDDFDRVHSVKVDGLRNLLDLLGQEELKALVLFSSVTARYGRIGQLAYASANEVLNKTAQIEARRRPGCRVVSVNWGPWEGGMVTPALRKQFESEGVGLIPLIEGGLFLVHELNATGRAVEVLALGKPKPAGSPGSGVVATPAPRSAGSGVAPMPATPAATASAELLPVFERTLDVESHPVLRSHVLDGRAVLPIALHLEFLAHAALHGHPGLLFHGFNDLRITQAVKLDADETLQVKAYAGKAQKQDKHFLVTVELRGKPKGGRETLKSRAEIVLVAALPKAPAADRPPTAPPCPHSVEAVYSEYLFHGPDLHGLESVNGASDLAMLGSAVPAPAPADWFQYPLRSTWIADPLIVDCSFQLMCLWSKLQHEAGSVPNFVGRYRQYRRHFPEAAANLVARITRDNGTFARADIDYLDADGQIIAQVQDYECVIDKATNAAYRRNRLGMVKA